MSYDFFPGNFTASAKCGKVYLTCWATSYVSVIADEDNPHAFTYLEVTAETESEALSFTVPVEFWTGGECAEGPRYYETFEALDNPYNIQTEEEATAEEVKAFETFAGSPSAFYGAIDRVARRVAYVLMGPALDTLREALEEERAA